MKPDKPLRILILITWSADKEWPFVDALRNQGFECDVIGANFPRMYNSHLEKLLFFWPRYILIGIKAWFRRKDYDVILPWQQVNGFVYGFLKRTFRSRYPLYIVLKFVYPTRKNPIISKIRHAFVNYVLGAADALWCVSNEEIRIRTEMFNIPKEKARFIPIIPTDVSDAAEEYRHLPVQGDYILSIGNQRDYGFLVDVVKDLDVQLKIVSMPFNVKGLDIPPNVEVIHAFGEKVMELFHHCRFVVIPMAYNERPGGESVMLEAMAYGKPIIMTNTVTSPDFIVDGENGILYELGDQEALKKAILYYWENPEIIQSVGEKNRKRFADMFSTQASARNAGQAIQELISSRS